jgi:hypothetical protein
LRPKSQDRNHQDDYKLKRPEVEHGYMIPTTSAP